MLFSGYLVEVVEKMAPIESASVENSFAPVKKLKNVGKAENEMMVPFDVKHFRGTEALQTAGRRNSSVPREENFSIFIRFIDSIDQNRKINTQRFIHQHTDIFIHVRFQESGEIHRNGMLLRSLVR